MQEQEIVDDRGKYVLDAVEHTFYTKKQGGPVRLALQMPKSFGKWEVIKV